MTFLVDRVAELRLHLAHLEELGRRGVTVEGMRRDLSLHNDVLFSLLMVCQLVIDVAAELSARHHLPFNDYTEAVKNFGRLGVAGPDVDALAALPGFRNVLVHEYVNLDLERAVAALDALAPVHRLADRVAALEAAGSS
jgi:uncharacterized protein YutE (UPF0331/DUF86 family)